MVFVVVGTYTKRVSDEFALEQGLKFRFFKRRKGILSQRPKMK